MPHVRSSPFDLVFESAAQTTFPAIRSALTSSGQDARDRDAFLMVRDVIMLLRDLRPEGGLGEGIEQLAGLIHHGYLFWDAGCITLEWPLERLPQLLGPSLPFEEEVLDRAPTYNQLPEYRLWAQVVSGETPEPLDGFFHYSEPASRSHRILGVFGIHAERPGFSVVEVAGPRPQRLVRQDGSPLFSSTLPGGSAAGLYSIVGEEELLELGARSWELGARASPDLDLSSKLPAPS
jgi:hypothetical protein